MSHPFHTYVNQQLEERLKKHSVVVFYDPRCEFAPFIDELRETGSARRAPACSGCVMYSMRSKERVAIRGQ